MNESIPTLTESVILIIVSLVILILLWRYESYIELDISPQTDKVEKTPQPTYKSAMGLMYGLLVRDLTRRGVWEHFRLNLNKAY